MNVKPTCCWICLSSICMAWRSLRSSAPISRRQVVFPEPDGPRMEKNSPSVTSRSTPSTATTSPKRLRTPSSRTAARAARGAWTSFTCTCGCAKLPPKTAGTRAILTGRGRGGKGPPPGGLGQPPHDVADRPGASVDQPRVHLDGGGARVEAGKRVGRGEDAATGVDGERFPGRRPHLTDDPHGI